MELHAISSEGNQHFDIMVGGGYSDPGAKLWVLPVSHRMSTLVVWESTRCGTVGVFNWLLTNTRVAATQKT